MQIFKRYCCKINEQTFWSRGDLKIDLKLPKNILKSLEKLDRTNFIVNTLPFEEKYDLTVDFQILKFTCNYNMKLTSKYLLVFKVIIMYLKEILNILNIVRFIRQEQ